MPIRRGNRGSAALRAASKRPSAAELLLERLETPAELAFAGLLEVVDDQLELAARLVESHAGAQEDLHAVASARRARRGSAVGNMAQRTCASSSFSVKYQCPDAGRDRFDSSPVIHSDGKPPSSRPRASRFRRLTV